MSEISVKGSARAALTSAFPGILLALVVLLPFLNKAFTLDDVTFLLQAQHILHDPLHPTAFDMVFDGERIRLSSELVSGPVMAYLLVPSVLAGGSEWIAHLTQAIVLITGFLFTALLARRLGLDRLQIAVAVCLLVASPAVLPMAATAMPDIAAMAFAVAGIERFLAWQASRRWIHGILSAAAFALAALARPQAILLLGCVGLSLICSVRWRESSSASDSGGGVRVVGPLLLAGLLLIGVNFITRDPASGKDLAATTVSRFSAAKVWLNLANFPLQWAVTFPLALMWPVLEGPSFFRRPRVWVGSVLGLVLAWLGGYAPLAPFIGIGTAVLVDIVAGAFTQRDSVRLMLGSWLLIGASAAPYAHLPAKYLVPSAPAMAILLASRPTDRLKLNTPILATFGAIGIVLAVLIIRADSALAEIGRIGGRLVAEQVGKGERVWMDGSWGFQWYAMSAGALPLATTAPFPQRGDIVVAGFQPRQLRTDYPKKTLLHREIFDAPGGRLFGEIAGFYGSGPFPWAWERSELGRLEVWRIDETRVQP